MNSALIQQTWAPGTPEEQATLLRTHPVYLRAYTLPTPSVQAACDLIKERIIQGAPCCGFMGPPRFGKTWAANYVLQEITSEFPEIYVIPIICKKHNSQNPAMLCDWFSMTTGGPSSRSRKDDPMIALVRRWTAEALSRASQRIVLIVDEIWRLTEDQLTTLADVTNLLQKEGIRTTCVSFSSLEALSTRATLLQANRTDLIGRFLSRLHSFDGTGSAAGLKSILEAFDDAEIAEFPANSGCSFSQFFLPKAYAQGWRLSSCAAPLWKEFQEASPKKRGIQIGAEYVFMATEWFLKKSISTTTGKDGVNLELLKTAVSESGYADSLYTVEA